MTTAHPEDASTGSATGRLDILLLQGPVGPFFDDLARALAARGLTVGRVTFTQGDAFYARAAPTLPYRGDLAGWQRHLDGLLKARNVGLVVMFGDGRPVHVAAAAACRSRGIPVWCLEEGYIRPGFVTLEMGGNNASSPLAGGAAPATSPLPTEPDPDPRELRAMAVHATLQHVVSMSRLRRYADLHHRPRRLVREGWRWIANVAMAGLGSGSDARAVDDLVGSGARPRFLVALQVHDDMQLLRYGRGWTMERVIDEITGSFAAHAPDDAVLIFKTHPLDRGHRPYRRWIERAAADHRQPPDRIRLIQTGPIATLLRECAGLVTVNSTAGLSGLHHGRPVLTLGEALYAGPGLAVTARGVGDIDRFWRSPQPPDPAAWTKLRLALHAHALVPGSFYGRSVRLRTAERVATKLAAALAAARTSQGIG